MNSGNIGQVYDIEKAGSARKYKFFPVIILIKINSEFFTFWIPFIRNRYQWRIFVKTVVNFPISHVCEILDLMSNCKFVNKNISSRS
jgi:hypothetical protein